MNIIKQVYYLTEPVLTSHVQQKRSNQFTYILPITHSILSAVICEQSVPRKELNFCIENLLIKSEVSSADLIGNQQNYYHISKHQEALNIKQ